MDDFTEEIVQNGRSKTAVDLTTFRYSPCRRARELCLFRIWFFHFTASPLPERMIIFFLFSFNYRCQGVVPDRHPGLALYYFFIYFNYLHDVNLSLLLIFPPFESGWISLNVVLKAVLFINEDLRQMSTSHNIHYTYLPVHTTAWLMFLIVKNN